MAYPPVRGISRLPPHFLAQGQSRRKWFPAPLGRRGRLSRELAPHPFGGQTMAEPVVAPTPCLLTPGPGGGQSLRGRGPTQPQSALGGLAAPRLLPVPPTEPALRRTPVFLSPNVTVPGAQTAPSRKLPYLCRVSTGQNRPRLRQRRSRRRLGTRPSVLVRLTGEQSNANRRNLLTNFCPDRKLAAEA